MEKPIVRESAQIVLQQGIFIDKLKKCKAKYLISALRLCGKQSVVNNFFYKQPINIFDKALINY